MAKNNLSEKEMLELSKPLIEFFQKKLTNGDYINYEFDAGDGKLLNNSELFKELENLTPAGKAFIVHEVQKLNH